MFFPTCSLKEAACSDNTVGVFWVTFIGIVAHLNQSFMLPSLSTDLSVFVFELKKGRLR